MNIAVPLNLTNAQAKTLLTLYEALIDSLSTSTASSALNALPETADESLRRP